MKLQELIEIYRHRVHDLRAEHNTISQDEEKGNIFDQRKILQNEISQIRDELYKLQIELGFEPDVVNLNLMEMDHNAYKNIEPIDMYPTKQSMDDQ